MDIKITVNEPETKTLSALIERLGALVTLVSAVAEAELGMYSGEYPSYAVGLDYLSRELENVYADLYDCVG